MIKFISITLLVLNVAFTTGAFAQLDGNLKLWTKNDFLNFDEVGDCLGVTGDISSVFARKSNNDLILRITYDNMVKRVENKVVADNFEGKNLQVEITISHTISKLPLLNETISVQDIYKSGEGVSYRRTLNNNLLEIALENSASIPLESEFLIQVLIDNKMVDEFSTVGKNPMSTGNCAFVHHGNQGLTFTDVFYGNAFGISGLDGSGYDEVLQVHEATQIPGNFHMSGTLMPAAEWHNPEFNDWLETMAGNGQASMMTSALGQHIMPFVANDMNNWSVYTESQMVDYLYNYTPRIAWIPERVWLAQGYYPDAGVMDWLGDNWQQHGVWGVVLDDWPHLNGYDNSKIHWMNNGSGVNLRVIPINNSFVGNMHYNATAAKNQIASMGQFNICVYGTDWEVAAEMNEHDGTFFLDNYEDVLWYCHDNYPAVNVWKLEDAIQNPDFNGSGAEITPGTYGLLGGTGGYGGSNNSWYSNWASTPSHSDFHNPQWDYGTVWNDAHTFLTSVTDNNLAQLGWYTLMINLHETGWHTSGEIADWEHRYSSHIKNANVYTEASRWADGQYLSTTACFFSDIDHDGGDELVMHNDKVFMVFEGIGGKANWVFYKNGFGDAYSVVSSDMAYWAETDGDYNENSSNHMAALSDVSPYQQNSIYNINILQSSGDTVKAVLDQFGVEKTFILITGNDFLDVEYNFFSQTGYIKSGWSPDLLDIIWSGKSHLERMWGQNGSYCGYRNSASGATAALILGNGGAAHNFEFEGTLVKGDEIYGYNKIKVRLYAGYTSPPTGTEVSELNLISADNMDVFPPSPNNPAALVSTNEVIITFDEAVGLTTSQNTSNYIFQNFTGSYSILSAVRQADWTKVKLTINETFLPDDSGEILLSNIEDLHGNKVIPGSSIGLTIPTGITPHTIIVDGINDFILETELIESLPYSLYITWDNNNLYIGFNSLDLGTADLFVSIDTDQTPGNGATSGSWGRVDFTNPYLPEYMVAIEGGGNSMQVNNFDGVNWNYPGNGVIGSSYEGWFGNGFTEISIPWSSLGNPVGIALAVHVSEEDNQIVPVIFPSLNTTGNHPTINHFYAFFSPYFALPLPASGVEPNNVFTVPNSAPQIISSIPAEGLVELLVGESENFSVSASDAENDLIFYTWKLDGLTVGTSNSYIFNATTGNIGSHTLIAIVTDQVPGNETDTAFWNIQVIETSISLNIKVYLEGPFNGINMNTDLNDLDLIPLLQPYSSNPWNYSGTEEVISIPGINLVDWVLIELRDAPNAVSANPTTIVAQKACFVKSNGRLAGIDGSLDLKFNLSISDSLFVIVYHRDHLGIMSSFGLKESGGIYSWDFSTSENKVFGGNLGYKEIAPGIWGMVGGDANADGEIDELDRTEGWNDVAGNAGYVGEDFSLDAQINNTDKNDIWLPNTGFGSQVSDLGINKYTSQIPK